ncbi:MAG: tRNA uridine(34) 5-carboxymethylaminomethyl modification radical SAM/GNAT enzyme Elp3, partial [Methanomicrobiales archaeon]|nr:tRNA uridine(34) 5-carboxymethylaminomethyl modification radical SAM/GNAT enzyme Elp3 [Methanomicrobiales archaeon]
APCPHGKCLPCPGGPDHPFRSPQSYTGEEPAALRGREHAFEPYAQVTARLAQLNALGHRVGKAELIVMGGTITARTPEYQSWFVTRCLAAMNDFPLPPPGPAGSMEDIARANETSRVRCIGITFETRPDYCGTKEIDGMLSLGVTKVELGVQHVNDAVLLFNRRGCTVADTERANLQLRDAALKVGFHVMPNLPASTLAADRAMFSTLFSDPRFCPDFLKIYPTLVTPGSPIETLWRAGAYAPYSEAELVELIAFAKSVLPEYVRLQRVQRDIPAKLICAGSRHSNFRQLARQHLEEKGGSCRCIRCREAGRAAAPAHISVGVFRYPCCRGTEHFISAGSPGTLIGFARLRYPFHPHRPELEGAALLRELHVYGTTVPVGSRPGQQEWQHRSFGAILLSRAEELASSDGYGSIAVMSGIGVRPYYRRQGYERAGPYMIKRIR